MLASLIWSLVDLSGIPAPVATGVPGRHGILGGQGAGVGVQAVAKLDHFF